MHHRIRRRIAAPSPATALALLALFVSLSGTGYAVSQLPRNSVGTAQLKNNAVVTSKIKNGTLLAADFKAGEVPAGPAGPAGAPGIVGGTVVYYDQTTILDGNMGFERVRCENGKTALYGGAQVQQAVGDNAVLVTSMPTHDADRSPGLGNGATNFTRWFAVADNPPGGFNGVGRSAVLAVWIVCAA